MNDEIVQLKTLQTMLILFQSHLHPESEVATINGFDSISFIWKVCFVLMCSVFC
jgi:hypothetical protein